MTLGAPPTLSAARAAMPRSHDLDVYTTNYNAMKTYSAERERQDLLAEISLTGAIFIITLG
jgi:hypothetical protein